VCFLWQGLVNTASKIRLINDCYRIIYERGAPGGIAEVEFVVRRFTAVKSYLCSSVQPAPVLHFGARACSGDPNRKRVNCRKNIFGKHPDTHGASLSDKRSSLALPAVVQNIEAMPAARYGIAYRRIADHALVPYMRRDEPDLGWRPCP
jgi:hypothetical protein